MEVIGLNEGMKRVLGSIVVAAVVMLATVTPARAHQPVTLGASSATAGRSPILVDGTISFAVYTNFSKGNETRNVRFMLEAGETIKVEYLILDRAPERNLKPNQLPRVAITGPTGRVIELPVRERTPFYEPFGGQNYFYLSRINMPGQPGIYTVTMKSRVKSGLVLAVGSKEVRGDVLTVGMKASTCPARLSSESEISKDRADQLIGMTERASKACALANRWGYRVGERDGEPFAVTMDYRPDRVTVVVKSDRVTAVTVG